MAALPQQDVQSFKDKITFNGASKMMNSAIFGQLIILIVFITLGLRLYRLTLPQFETYKRQKIFRRHPYSTMLMQAPE